MDADGAASRGTAPNDRLVRARDVGARSAHLSVGDSMSTRASNAGTEPVGPVSSRPVAAPSPELVGRPQARGKFVFAGTEKIFLRGVVYGAFRPDASGREYQGIAAVE